MSTSTTIKKFFTDFDAEEAWLNQMSAQGKELVNIAAERTHLLQASLMRGNMPLRS